MNYNYAAASVVMAKHMRDAYLSNFVCDESEVDARVAQDMDKIDRNLAKKAFSYARPNMKSVTEDTPLGKLQFLSKMANKIRLDDPENLL